MLSLTDFTYDLPPELIAQEPAHPRDSARLMVIDRQSGDISHHHVSDLPSLLGSDWALVANNTKVFPARLQGTKTTGGRVELLLLKPLGQSTYECLCKPGLKEGVSIAFDRNLHANVLQGSSTQTREIIVQFDQEESNLRTTLSEIGSMPTPPYIKKMLANKDDYQTIYAKYGFSAAAPTAGLHFTPELLRKIQSEHPWFEITLDVGLGTFLPVQVDDVTTHHMHSEKYTITPEIATSLNESKQDHKLLGIGTTTTRALESSLDGEEKIQPRSTDTSIFIYPPYRFHSIDGLMTNFHLPESTLLMMVSAFVSDPNTSQPFITFADSLLGRAYKIAVEEKYRFFSFGDAMLII
jgi:S-adenosylmethionine:tRNA ribosyltransferase-isomerase